MFLVFLLDYLVWLADSLQHLGGPHGSFGVIFVSNRLKNAKQLILLRDELSYLL
jgi:hypothetical protein